MVKQTLWVERTFEFNFPVGIFPCILERLRGTPVRLTEMTMNLSQRTLTAKIDNGWSVQEHIGHLFDLDELHDGRIDDFLAHAEVLRAADIQNKKTHAANYNGRTLRDLLAEFKAARQHFVDRLTALNETDLNIVSLHPRLKKPMRLVDMAWFVAEHDDHHLARITELSRQSQ